MALAGVAVTHGLALLAAVPIKTFHDIPRLLPSNGTWKYTTVIIV
jgi:hypothetical protein